MMPQADEQTIVNRLHGTSANLSFRVGSTLVKTNASTQFKDAACASLKVADSVEVKGARQTDNSVLASRVERKK